MKKINYSQFEDTDFVSSKQRELYLDLTQFDGIPSGSVLIEKVSLSKRDSNGNDKLENIKAFKIRGKDLDKIKMIEKSGIDDGMKRMMLGAIPDVKFKVFINCGESEKADENFNFIHDYILSELKSEKGVILSGLKYKVLWQWSNQYKDYLSLVVDSFKGVKVENSK